MNLHPRFPLLGLLSGAALLALLAAPPAAARDGVRSWHGGTQWSHGGTRPGGPVVGGAPRPVWRPAPVWRAPVHGYYRPWPGYGYGYGGWAPVWPAATVWIGGAPYHRGVGGGGVWVSPVPGAYPAPAVVDAVPPGPPAPVVSPRMGQSPQQAEADFQDCSRLAAHEPAAQADAVEFQRQVGACLDGRGYGLAPAAP